MIGIIPNAVTLRTQWYVGEGYDMYGMTNSLIMLNGYAAKISILTFLRQERGRGLGALGIYAPPTMRIGCRS